MKDAAHSAKGDEAEMTIGQMCAAFDVTPRTLRFYEAKGLLAPRRDGQRRLYSARERGRLALILRGKRFGFSLAKIHELLDLYDPADPDAHQVVETVKAARARLAEMRAQRAELDDAIRDLTTQIDAAEAAIAGRKG